MHMMLITKLIEAMAQGKNFQHPGEKQSDLTSIHGRDHKSLRDSITMKIDD
jgi:hypothetical protein